MKKINTLAIATLLSLFSFASYAEMAVGVTANWAYVDTKGQETLRDSSEITKGSSNEDVLIPEVFVESLADWGAIGVAYVPVQEIGSKSRSDTNSEGDTGTYKAEAEVSDHIMVYVNYNLAEVANHSLYAVGGVSMAEIKTGESLNSGSSYGDEDVFGYTLGAGLKADIGSNMFYKLEATYTDYDAYEESSNNNKIENEDRMCLVIL